MNMKLYGLLKYLILFLVGGITYYIIETIYKGITKGVESHWTMIAVGGVCFVCVGLINNVFSWTMALWKQMLISAIIITIIEFISGYIINILLNWQVWDYSHLPFNIKGQVCLWFSLIWYFISALAIVLDDYLRYLLFGGRKPQYKIF